MAMRKNSYKITQDDLAGSHIYYYLNLVDLDNNETLIADHFLGMVHMTKFIYIEKYNFLNILENLVQFVEGKKGRYNLMFNGEGLIYIEDSVIKTMNVSLIHKVTSFDIKRSQEPVTSSDIYCTSLNTFLDEEKAA